MIEAFTNLKMSLQALRATRRGEEGVATAEYAILLALVAVAIVSAAVILGLAIVRLFDRGTTGVGGV